MWTLEEAIKLLRELEPTANAHGLHLGITGSVLYKGESQKDLDIVVYPRKTTQTNIHAQDGMKFRVAVAPKWNFRTPYHPEDTKEVWSAILSGKKIDFFFLK